MAMSKLFSSVSLKGKILALVGILLLFTVVSGGHALRSMSSINLELDAIAKQDIPLTSAVTKVTISQLEQAIWFERLLAHGKEMADRASEKARFEKALNHYREYSKQLDKALQDGESLAAEAIKRAHTEQDRAEFEQVLTKLTAIEEAHTQYDDHVGQVLGLLTEGQVYQALELAEKVESEEERIDHELEALLFEIERFTNDAAKKAEEHEHQAQAVLLWIVVFSLLTGILLAVWIVRDITRRIAYGISIAETVASGDLRQAVAVNGDDEIGRLLAALAAMRDDLFRVINEMHQSSNSLSVSAEELSTVTNQMTASSDSQRDNLFHVATAFNEMTATAQEVARNAANTAATTTNATSTSQHGRQVVEDAVGAIQSLAGEVDNAAAAIEKLGRDSQSIGTVIDVIKSIAEQTNLLALNAAIEAARAGEQGRGFAVVADEVRTLAQRTQESTSEIETMIDRLQNSARDAVQTMENGRSRAQDGVGKVAIAAEALEEITSAIASISDMNMQNASAAEEQTSVSEEINRNITSISHAAEQNAAAMTQTTGASERLARMAENMNGIIDQFRLS